MQDRITKLASMAMTNFKFSHQRKTQKVKMRYTLLMNKYLLLFSNHCCNSRKLET